VRIPRSQNSRSTETWHLDEAIAGTWIRSAHLGKRRTYGKGEFLYHQDEVGTEFFFILRGRVQVSIFRGDGSEFVFEIMGRWALCGEGAAFDHLPRFSNAVALDKVEVIIFDSRDMYRAFRDLPELAISLLRISSLKQRTLAVRMQSLSLPKPELRISELLNRLADLYGTNEGGATLIGISLTHEQIAAMTGASRVTVTRTLKRLKAEGVIGIRGKQLLVIQSRR
jgi:CRP-like cAMP-binding protein